MNRIGLRIRKLHLLIIANNVFYMVLLRNLITIQSKSIKMRHLSMVHCFNIRGQISMYVIWLGRVILSNYLDTTFDEY